MRGPWALEVNEGTESALLPASLPGWGQHRDGEMSVPPWRLEGLSFPLRNSPITHRSQKMLDPMVGHLQVLGNRWGVLRDGPLLVSPLLPSSSFSHQLPCLCPSPAITPSPVTACLLLTLSLCLLGPPRGCRSFSLSVSVICLPTYLPISSPAGQSTLPLSTWLLSHQSCCPTCPPPSVCLSQAGS